MASKARSASPEGWSGAEGQINGKPILIRGKRLLQKLIPNRNLPFLFVVTLKYAGLVRKGLPTASQYDVIGRFEHEVLDAVDRLGIGSLVLIETNNGAVRYYCYVAD